MGNEVKKCAVITGAPENDINYYHSYLIDRYIISADSGFEKCVNIGIKPDLIIGDFDSSAKPDTDIETITLPVMKDDTDTFFAVKEAVKRGYNDIIILGGIGSRVDHTYSNILSLNYCNDLRVSAMLVNRSNRIRILNSSCVIKKDGYNYLSLFALFEECKGLTTKGTLYNLTDYNLSPQCQLCQSNSFVNDEIEISFDCGKILLVESND